MEVLKAIVNVVPVAPDKDSPVGGLGTVTKEAVAAVDVDPVFPVEVIFTVYVVPGVNPVIPVDVPVVVIALPDDGVVVIV